MSEPAETAAQDASAPAASTQQASEPPKSIEPGDPSWLAPRLAQQKRSLLKQFGVESDEEAKALIEDARKLRAEKLSGEERMQARIKELEAAAIERDELKQSVASQASEALAALSAEQRAAVEALAGDAPSKQLKAIAALRPTWASPAAPIKLAPANTTPAAKSPPAASSEEENVLQTYERLSKADPERAAQYRLDNWPRYVEALKSRG